MAIIRHEIVEQSRSILGIGVIVSTLARRVYKGDLIAKEIQINPRLLPRDLLLLNAIFKIASVSPTNS